MIYKDLQRYNSVEKPKQNLVLIYEVNKDILKKLFKQLHQTQHLTATLTDIEESLIKTGLKPTEKQEYVQINDTSSLHGIVQTKKTVTGFCSTLTTLPDIPIQLAKLYCIHNWNHENTQEVTLHIHRLLPIT